LLPELPDLEPEPAPLPPLPAPPPSRLANAVKVLLALLLMFALGGGAAFFALRKLNPDATTSATGDPERTPDKQDDKGLIVGPGHIATIGEALGMARTDQVDTIKVLPGTYPEALRLDRRVRLVGAGPSGAVVVNGGNAPALTVDSDGVSVSGLSLRSDGPASSEHPATVRITRGSAKLKECDIGWEQAAGADPARSGACVEVTGASSRPTLEHCVLHHGQLGLLCRQGAEVALRHCALENNHIGLQVDEGGKGRLVDCRVENSRSVGVYLGKGAEVVMEEDCRVLKGTDGVVFDTGSRGRLDGCHIEGQDNDGVWIKEGAQPELTRCHILHAMNALHVSGGKCTLDRCFLSGSRNNGALVRGGRVLLTHCQLHGNRFHGVYVLTQGQAELHQCSTCDNQEGSGVKADAGGTARLIECKSSGNKSWGLEARGAGSKLDARGCQRGDLAGNRKGPCDGDPVSELQEPGE
jgi:hypothetical protein